jgi:hypothetical protein
MDVTGLLQESTGFEKAILDRPVRDFDPSNDSKCPKLDLGTAGQQVPDQGVDRRLDQLPVCRKLSGS